MPDSAITSPCCNAELEDRDGGFWVACSRCGGEVNPDEPPLCPGSFTLNYREETMYGGTCDECDRRLFVGVGYKQYGDISGALQPHQPRADTGMSNDV